MNTSVVVQAAPLGVGAKDAAKRIGISVRSLRRGVEDGRIPRPLRIGGRSIWAAEALKTWFSGGCPAVSALREWFNAGCLPVSRAGES